MSNEAHDQEVTRAAKKPAKKPGARARKPKAVAATVKTPRGGRISSAVPEISVAAPDATSRRASPVRLGLLTATLALMIGYLAWFNGATEFASESFQVAFGSPAATSEPAPADPLPEYVRDSIDRELRLAAMALEIRESQESLSRLWDDAKSLASSIGALAGGVENLKSNAAAALARVDERIDHIEVAAALEPALLGDPALRPDLDVAAAFELILLGDPALRKPTLLADSESGLSETVQPVTTGGLAEAGAPPQATVQVSLAKPKRVRALKPLDGWVLHSVREDLALVQGKNADYEVRAGELLPEVGIVRSIKKQGEGWVVLTNKGVITEPKTELK